jgi:hypothetical protein
VEIGEQIHTNRVILATVVTKNSSNDLPEQFETVPEVAQSLGLESVFRFLEHRDRFIYCSLKLRPSRAVDKLAGVRS